MNWFANLIMATQDLEISDFVNYLATSQKHLKSVHPGVPSTKNLKALVKYITALREDGTLNDEQFTNLLVFACSIFIEREVEERVNKVLADKFPLFFVLTK